MSIQPKNRICIWFDGDAEEAARFYAATFPDSSVDGVMRVPSDDPSEEEGDVLMMDFTMTGIRCLGSNGGPGIPHSMAYSFQVATDPEDTDRCWNAILDSGGEASECRCSGFPPQ